MSPAARSHAEGIRGVEGGDNLVVVSVFLDFPTLLESESQQEVSGNCRLSNTKGI